VDAILGVVRADVVRYAVVVGIAEMTPDKDTISVVSALVVGYIAVLRIKIYSTT